MFLLLCSVYGVVFTTGAVDCSRCEYTKGQIWLEDRYNCHLYYICEPLGNGVYRVHHVTCGDLFWNQPYHTCVPVMPRDANCKIGPVSPFPPEPTVILRVSVAMLGFRRKNDRDKCSV